MFDLLSFSEQGWGNALLKGLWMTLQISAGSFAVGLLIGLVVACAKLSAPRPIAMLMRGYTTVFRAVPELLLILLLYYAGSMGLNALMLWLGFAQFNISGPLVAVLVLGLVQGAYASEIFRAAILAIPHGQIEAARAFGLSGFGLFRRVTLPIMAPYALAGMSNLWINLIKDSALISVVGTNELLYTAKQAAGSTRHYLLFYLTAAALYYLVTLASNYLSGRLERRIRRWMPVVDYYAGLLAKGLQTTLSLLVISAVLGFALAVLVALARLSRRKWLARCALGYTSVLRGTPLLIQIYIFYYGLGSLFAQFPMIRGSFLWPFLRDGYWYIVFALVLSVGAYVGEVIRGGLLAVPKGEMEAASAFGMTPRQALLRVRLPRAMRLLLPTLAGETVMLLKSTALASTIAVVDLLGAANVVPAAAGGRGLPVPDLFD
eukprot:gene7610-8904_t